METGRAVRWHQALVIAVTGELRPGLGRQEQPDLDEVLDAVRGRRTGVHPVPGDLVREVGAARFAAVLGALRARLAAGDPRPVLADRAPDADERRLLTDVPPHHGS